MKVYTLTILRRPENWILLLFAAIKLLIPFLIHPDWGLHRDEFLYLAMGDHLGWGYLEVPPLIAIMGKLTLLLFGKSIIMVHFFPSLCGGLTLILTGLIARQLGGRLFAQVLAASAYLLSLVYLRANILFQPVTIDILFFVLAVYVFLKILHENKPLHWILLGLVIGIGILNKYTMLLFAFGMVIGLLLTPYRRVFRERWIWIAGAIAFVIWLPNLLWQHQNGWPFFEHMRILSERQLSNMNPLIFLLVQILMNVHALWLWVIGVLFFMFSRQARDERPLGWMYFALLIVLLALSGKVYYLAPAYPMLFAGGARAIEIYRDAKARRWVTPVAFALLLLGSIHMIPVGLPVFSVQGMIRYFEFSSKYLGTAEALRWETGEMHELPQDYADMLGWEEQVRAVAETYHSLPDSERARCAIFATNYGQAGAIDYYGDRYGLPNSISKGSSYWLWGYREYDGECMVMVGYNEQECGYFYNEVTPGVSYYAPHAREDDTAINIVRKPKMPIGALWEDLKQYRY